MKEWERGEREERERLPSPVRVRDSQEGERGSAGPELLSRLLLFINSEMSRGEEGEDKTREWGERERGGEKREEGE